MTKNLKKTITAIVLAGGKSSRMGRDKALLKLRDRTLLWQICTIADECACRVYIITPWTEKYRDIVPQKCQLIQEKLLSSENNSNSPLTGFAQGLQLVETPWVLLLACDLPQLRSSQVKQWSENLATVLPTEIALLPRHPKGWEPLCGFYRADCRPLLEAYIAEGKKSFQGFLQQHPVRELKNCDPTCLFNCNTPEDWQTIINEQ